MNTTGPILIVEDDEDDAELIAAVFKELGYSRKLIFQANGRDALQFLTATKIRTFLVISDINMPLMNGYELAQAVFDNPQLRLQAIPFVFFTTGDGKGTASKAYQQPVQGLFRKPSTFSGYKDVLKQITAYWEVSLVI